MAKHKQINAMKVVKSTVELNLLCIAAAASTGVEKQLGLAGSDRYAPERACKPDLCPVPLGQVSCREPN